MKKITATATPFKSIIATLSITGKVGKSVTANNLLLPRMAGAKLFRLETDAISGDVADDVEVKKMQGRDLEQLLKNLGTLDSAIVDIGSSNISSFLIGLAQDTGAQNMFDYFIVPIKSDSTKINEFREFVKTVSALSKNGVSPDRIKVIFNMHDPEKEVKSEMAMVFNFHKQHPIFSLDEEIVIHQTDLFKSLALTKKTFDEMLADKSNYFKELKQTPITETKKREDIIKIARAQGLVSGVNAELDAVFSKLFGEPSGSATPATTEDEFNISDFD